MKFRRREEYLRRGGIEEFIVIRVLIPRLPIITRNHVRTTTTSTDN